jgi:hypothetical protein
MKQLLILLTFVCTVFVGYTQTGPPAPSNGVWAIIDTQYQVGPTSLGHTLAKVTLKNTTLTKYTAVQFRVFYDKIAFTGATVSLIGSTTNLDFQYSTNTANGYITMTLVYTGASATYTLTDGERFLIDFTHAPEAVFNNLASISNLTWTGAQSYTQYAAKQVGTDTTLNLHNYGGQFIPQTLSFHGTFTNTTGTPAKNLHLALERKPYNSATWTQHSTYVTNLSGNFNFTVNLDTSYWDVRLAIQGDTMGVGNVITATDAQLINQWVLGNSTQSGFDFFTAEVNGSNNTTISDVWGVFGRVSGRFSQWPNNVKDVKFFNPTEYAAINGSATNLTATYPGTTNFYHNILAGQPDSIVRYVLVPGDASGTGYHMARQIPIEILINPTPGIESQVYHVIDQSVEYDFPTSSIEVNVPRLSVDAGNLVNLPVKVYTNGTDLASLQFGLKYDPEVLEFKGIFSNSNVMKWITYVNPNDGEVDWGGYDPTNVENPVKNGEEVINLQFLALQPQGEWLESPLYTTRKFAGTVNSNDLSLTPTDGILQVLKAVGAGIIDDNSIEVFPNPFNKEVTMTFKVDATVDATLAVYDIYGRKVASIISGPVPEGQFTYTTDLGKLAEGVYIVTLKTEDNAPLFERIIKQK